MLTEKAIRGLASVLKDERSRVDELDDALMDLGDAMSLKALNVLYEYSKSAQPDEDILDASLGESIAQLMFDLNIDDQEYTENLSKTAMFAYMETKSVLETGANESDWPGK